MAYYSDRFEYSNENTPTIRFKTLFPDKATFVTKMKEHGLITEAEITDEYWNNISVICGNNFLKFRTDVKNYQAIAFAWVKLMKQKARYQKLYDIDPASIGTIINKNTSTYFEMDRTRTTGVPETDFIHNKVENINEAHVPNFQILKQINELVNMQDPDSWFILKFTGMIMETLIIKKERIYETI